MLTLGGKNTLILRVNYHNEGESSVSHIRGNEQRFGAKLDTHSGKLPSII